MKYILSLTILLLAFTRPSNAVLFITCEGDTTDCCCSEIYATDCYCAPTCPSDTYRIVSNFSAFLKWPSAAADSTSDLALTAGVKDGICVNANGPGWESVDRTTTTLKRDCTLYGTLSNTIYYTDSNGHNVEVNNSQSFVQCTPAQKSITIQKAETAYAYSPSQGSGKLYNQGSINDRTTAQSSFYPDRSGYILLGTPNGSQYDFRNSSNDRCYAYHVPYKFNLISPNILEHFHLNSVISVADVFSLVANNKLLKTFKEVDITSYGRVFDGYGQSDSKVDYCLDPQISNMHSCVFLIKDYTNCNADRTSHYFTQNEVSLVNHLSSGTNYIYLIYAIRKEGGGAAQLLYKFKDDVSVRFLENE